MTVPEEVSLRWHHGVFGGVVTSAYARVTLTSPIADALEAPNVISLDIEADGGGGVRWSIYHGGEEDAPLNENIKSGLAADLEHAKRDAFGAVFQYLTSLGHTDGDIALSISQPAGSLTLDLEDDYDDD